MKNTSVVNDLTLEAAVAVVNEDYMVTFSFSFLNGRNRDRYSIKDLRSICHLKSASEM